MFYNDNQHFIIRRFWSEKNICGTQFADWSKNAFCTKLIDFVQVLHKGRFSLVIPYKEERKTFVARNLLIGQRTCGVICDFFEDHP